MNIMSKNEIYDVSVELAAEFGEVGTQKREAAIAQAWEEYNAQILLDARKNAELTQEELAKRIGVNKGYISRIERGANYSYCFYPIPYSGCNGVNCRVASGVT